MAQSSRAKPSVLSPCKPAVDKRLEEDSSDYFNIQQRKIIKRNIFYKTLLLLSLSSQESWLKKIKVKGFKVGFDRLQEKYEVQINPLVSSVPSKDSLRFVAVDTKRHEAEDKFRILYPHSLPSEARDVTDGKLIEIDSEINKLFARFLTSSSRKAEEGSSSKKDVGFDPLSFVCNSFKETIAIIAKHGSPYLINQLEGLMINYYHFVFSNAETVKVEDLNQELSNILSTGLFPLAYVADLDLRAEEDLLVPIKAKVAKYWANKGSERRVFEDGRGSRGLIRNDEEKWGQFISTKRNEVVAAKPKDIYYAQKARLLAKFLGEASINIIHKYCSKKRLMTPQNSEFFEIPAIIEAAFYYGFIENEGRGINYLYDQHILPTVKEETIRRRLEDAQRRLASASDEYYGLGGAGGAGSPLGGGAGGWGVLSPVAHEGEEVVPEDYDKRDEDNLLSPHPNASEKKKRWASITIPSSTLDSVVEGEDGVSGDHDEEDEGLTGGAGSGRGDSFTDPRPIRNGVIKWRNVVTTQPGSRGDLEDQDRELSGDLVSHGDNRSGVEEAGYFPLEGVNEFRPLNLDFERAASQHGSSDDEEFDGIKPLAWNNSEVLREEEIGLGMEGGEASGQSSPLLSRDEGLSDYYDYDYDDLEIDIASEFSEEGYGSREDSGEFFSDHSGAAYNTAHRPLSAPARIPQRLTFYDRLDEELDDGFSGAGDQSNDDEEVEVPEGYSHRLFGQEAGIRVRKHDQGSYFDDDGYQGDDERVGGEGGGGSKGLSGQRPASGYEDSATPTSAPATATAPAAAPTPIPTPTSARTESSQSPAPAPAIAAAPAAAPTPTPTPTPAIFFGDEVESEDEGQGESFEREGSMILSASATAPATAPVLTTSTEGQDEDQVAPLKPIPNATPKAAEIVPVDNPSFSTSATILSPNSTLRQGAFKAVFKGTGTAPEAGADLAGARGAARAGAGAGAGAGAAAGEGAPASGHSEDEVQMRMTSSAMNDKMTRVENFTESIGIYKKKGNFIANAMAILFLDKLLIPKGGIIDHDKLQKLITLFIIVAKDNLGITVTNPRYKADGKRDVVFKNGIENLTNIFSQKDQVFIDDVSLKSIVEEFSLDQEKFLQAAISLEVNFADFNNKYSEIKLTDVGVENTDGAFYKSKTNPPWLKDIALYHCDLKDLEFATKTLYFTTKQESLAKRQLNEFGVSSMTSPLAPRSRMSPRSVLAQQRVAPQQSGV